MRVTLLTLGVIDLAGGIIDVGVLVGGMGVGVLVGIGALVEVGILVGDDIKVGQGTGVFVGLIG